jgi:LPS-assembly lipoprotein
VSVVNLAVTPEGSILRYNYIGSVTFQVRDSTGKVVTQGSANSFTASAATRSTIAAAASTTDATTRLMQILSDLVVTQLLATSAKWVTPAP